MHTKKFAKHFPEILQCCETKVVPEANTVFMVQYPKRYTV